MMEQTKSQTDLHVIFDFISEIDTSLVYYEQTKKRQIAKQKTDGKLFQGLVSVNRTYGLASISRCNQRQSVGVMVLVRHG